MKQCLHLAQGTGFANCTAGTRVQNRARACADPDQILSPLGSNGPQMLWPFHSPGAWFCPALHTGTKALRSDLGTFYTLQCEWLHKGQGRRESLTHPLQGILAPQCWLSLLWALLIPLAFLLPSQSAITPTLDSPASLALHRWRGQGGRSIYCRRATPGSKWLIFILHQI